jgi:hypothetical protein
MVHIAIACQRADVFTDDGLEFLHKMGYSNDDLLHTVAQPEGKYPIQLAIETNQPEIVKFLFRHGAGIHSVDPEGNNCLHIAALTSTQMIEASRYLTFLYLDLDSLVSTRCKTAAKRFK